MAAMVGQMEKIEMLMVNGRHLISPNVFCFRCENSAKPAKKIQTPIETVISCRIGWLKSMKFQTCLSESKCTAEEHAGMSRFVRYTEVSLLQFFMCGS